MKSTISGKIGAVFGAALFALTAIPAVAQDYPTKAVRLYAPSAGGSGDWAARVLAERLEKELGQPFVVENRANLVGIELTTTAEPDGYTLLFYGSGLWMFPLLQPDVAKYDTVTDLIPISSIAGSPSVLAVHNSLGVTTVQELIAKAQAEPGALNYSAGQIGSANHLAGELFKLKGGVDMTYVPYKGSGDAVTAAVSGEVMVTFGTVDVLKPHFESGILVPLAVMADEPSPLAPEIPTMSSAGVDGATAASKQVLWAPAGVPDSIIATLNAAVVKILADEETRNLYLSRGLEAKASTSDEVLANIEADMERGRAIAEEFKAALSE
jgi:tripartite-type tricarboxylate transporter receptor subunit TctC